MAAEPEQGAAGGLDLDGTIDEVAELAHHRPPEVEQGEETSQANEQSAENQRIFPAPTAQATKRLPDYISCFLVLLIGSTRNRIKKHILGRNKF